MLIGIKEVMTRTGVGRYTATQWFNDKTFPVKHGKNQTYRVDADAFDKWLEARYGKANNN